MQNDYNGITINYQRDFDAWRVGAIGISSTGSQLISHLHCLLHFIQEIDVSRSGTRLLKHGSGPGL
jgi:hypothetical protein